MTVKKCRPGAQLSKTYVESRDSDGGDLFEIPDSSPNSPAENTVNFSPDPSGFYLNLAEANRDNFTILDSRSPSPTFMFNISDSPVVRHLPLLPLDLIQIWPMRTKVFCYFGLSITISNPCWHGRYVRDLRFPTALSLSCANRNIFAIKDSPPPSPKYIDTEDMFMISQSPLSEVNVTFPIPVS